MRVLKALQGTDWCRVLFPQAFDQVEVRSHRIDHLLQIVPFDIQFTALLRTVFGKGREDKMSVWLQRVANVPQIKLAIALVR